MKSIKNITDSMRTLSGSAIIVTLGLLLITNFSAILRSLNLPMPLTTVLYWAILLLIPYVNRPVVFFLIISKTSYSIFNIMNSPRGISVNGIVANVISLIFAMIFAEVLYRIIYGLRNANKQLEIESKRAKDATEAKAKFLANMSHEIRTPISGIRGITEMMLSDDSKSVEDKEHLSMIHSSSDTLLHIVNNLLDFSRIEAKKDTAILESFNLWGTIRDIVESIRTTIADKGIHLKLKISSEVPEHIVSDKMKIKQIVSNLLSNGVKFTDYGTVIVLLEIQSENMLSISVKDTGIGIPVDKKEMIFTEFERLQTSYEITREGTGLGLAITKGLVEELKGEIHVESLPDVGSMFTVTIPFETADSDEITYEANDLEFKPVEMLHNDATNKDSSALSILVAEDNRVNQVYLRHFLEKQGFNLTIVDNGKEAVNSFFKNSYNAVLMDIQMPVMSGIQATKVMRNYEVEESKIKTPILALTASVSEEEQKLFLDSGMDAVCPKPVDVQHLLSTIQQHIN